MIKVSFNIKNAVKAPQCILSLGMTQCLLELIKTDNNNNKTQYKADVMNNNTPC